MSSSNAIEKTFAVYKGDVLAGIIFGIIGVVFVSVSFILLIFSTRIGYYYLGVGMLLFSLYGIGKGLSIIYVSHSRLKHYKSKNDLSDAEIKNELTYTAYRLKKKEKNRRFYAWIFGVGIMAAILGIFLNEKGLIIGTTLPIILFAAIEFVYGLMTEFRLWEYKRILEKLTN